MQLEFPMDTKPGRRGSRPAPICSRLGASGGHTPARNSELTPRSPVLAPAQLLPPAQQSHPHPDLYFYPPVETGSCPAPTPLARGRTALVRIGKDRSGE